MTRVIQFPEKGQKSIKMAFTICADCKHSSGVKRNMIWYDMRCKAPQARRPKGIDFVTGEEGYVDVNSLGMSYIVDEEWPYPRDINNDGNCPFYKGKSKREYDVTIEQNNTPTNKP